MQTATAEASNASVPKKPSTPTRSSLASAGLQMISPSSVAPSTSAPAPKVDAAINDAGLQKSARDEVKAPVEEGKVTCKAANTEPAEPQATVKECKQDDAGEAKSKGKESKVAAEEDKPVEAPSNGAPKAVPNGICDRTAPNKDAAASDKDGTEAATNGKIEPPCEKLVEQIHSAIRWDKSADDIEELVKKAGVSMSSVIQAHDPKNGNTSLHIAAQNGHVGLVKFVVGAKADVNAQNKKGQTALHMSVQYDCYFLSKFLIDSGADGKIKNVDGHEALLGIEGTKIDGEVWNHPLTMLKSAASKDELERSFTALEAADPTTIDKAQLVQTGMAKKRSLKDIWDISRFKEFMKKM